jgi:hypothetical protein
MRERRAGSVCDRSNNACVWRCFLRSLTFPAPQSTVTIFLEQIHHFVVRETA